MARSPDHGAAERGARRETNSITTNAGRRLQLLRAILEAEASGSRGSGVAAVADATARERSQVSRGLTLLESAGLIVRDEHTLEYSSSPALLTICASAGRPDLVRAARPALVELATTLGERTSLEVPRAHDSLVVDTVSSGEAVEAVTWIGRTSPRWCTAAGRASWFDDDSAAVRAMLRGLRFHAGPLAPTSAADVLRRLEADRDRGVAVAVGELEEGLVSIAVPVRDAAGVVGMITVAGPAYRLGDDIERCMKAVRAAVERVDRALREGDRRSRGVRR
jgi:DNA-binding IclR family transcriptional regulator